MSEIHDIMARLLEVQEDVSQLRVTRTQLELQLANVNAEIDANVQALNELQERLNRVIAAANLRAVTGDT